MSDNRGSKRGLITAVGENGHTSIIASIHVLLTRAGAWSISKRSGAVPGAQRLVNIEVQLSDSSNT